MFENSGTFRIGGFSLWVNTRLSFSYSLHFSSSHPAFNAIFAIDRWDGMKSRVIFEFLKYQIFRTHNGVLRWWRTHASTVVKEEKESQRPFQDDSA